MTYHAHQCLKPAGSNNANCKLHPRAKTSKPSQSNALLLLSTQGNSKHTEASYHATYATEQMQTVCNFSNPRASVSVVYATAASKPSQKSPITMLQSTTQVQYMLQQQTRLAKACQATTNKDVRLETLTESVCTAAQTLQSRPDGQGLSSLEKRAALAASCNKSPTFLQAEYSNM